jgi:tRNA nucleotidyltransferase (CCA-adding enzyme)
MREVGILQVTCPELVEQVGCAQNRHHALDVWTHTLRCVDAAPRETVLRLAALFHDLGKPRTRAISGKTDDYTFYDHERVGAEMADAWLKRYRFSNQERERIVHLIRHHLICYSEQWTDAAVRRFVRRVGEENIEALLALGRADLMAKGTEVGEEIELLKRLAKRVGQLVAEGAALGVKQLEVDGNDVMQRLQVPAGPVVGRMLESLLERVIEDPELNRRETLLSLMDTLAREED